MCSYQLRLPISAHPTPNHLFWKIVTSGVVTLSGLTLALKLANTLICREQSSFRTCSQRVVSTQAGYVILTVHSFLNHRKFVCFVLWSDYKKSLPGQFIRIRLQK